MKLKTIVTLDIFLIEVFLQFTGADEIDASLKIVIMTRDLTNSYTEFNTNIRATEMLKKRTVNYFDRVYAPGNFRLHGKLTVTAFDMNR